MTIQLIPSLFESYRPIERYLELAAPKRALEITAVDAFVLSQVPDAYGLPPTVLDLAADATSGASVALWAAQPKVRAVLAPPVAHAGNADWRGAFPVLAADLNIPSGRVRLDDGGPPSPTSPGRPVLVNVAMPDDAEAARRLLTDVLRRYPAAVVLLSPVGPAGASAVIEAGMSVCTADRSRRLTLFREASPFLATCRVGMIHPVKSAEADAVVGRVRRAFGGNFQFLTLLRTVTEQATRLATLEQSGGEVRTGRAAARRLDQDAYANLIDGVRRVSAEVLPAGATVLVVSKGDDKLLDLGQCRGLHFPQTPDGTYAGHHPPDGASAVRHLRALRTKGAAYLLVPAPFFWWLDHYADLRDYLEKVGRVVTCRPDTCVVYDLRPGRRSSRPQVKARARRSG